MRVINNLLRSLVSFLFDNRCSVCGKELEPDDVLFCKGCLEALARSNLQIEQIDELEFIIPLAPFDDVREAIHTLKYSGWKRLGRKLGVTLGEKLSRVDFLREFHILLPVPLHNTRKRERGFNQSLVISEGVSEVLGIPVEKKTVVRVKNTRSQTQLSEKERRKNVYEAFKVKAPDKITGKNIIIVDDVVTTGSTTKEITRVLKDAGARRVGVACIGRPKSKGENL
ncbi:ComF family protein [bacterium]|nr:ComF family protein [bacterium]